MYFLIQFKFKVYNHKFLNEKNEKKELVFLDHKNAQIENKINILIIKIRTNAFSAKKINTQSQEV